MKRIVSLGLLFIALGYAVQPLTVNAAQTQGLRISPPRTYLSADAGHQTPGTITIANTTSTTMSVNLTVQQFSVNDYVYTQTFSAVKQDWLHLTTSNVLLAAHQSTTVQYTLAPPETVTPGGYYFSIFASTELQKDGGTDTMQAANLLYVTVNGALTKTSRLTASHMPHLVFGNTIPYTFSVADTGNVHFFVFTQSTLSGLLTHESGTSQTHILLPATTRTITGALQSPVLPGLYHATYGYKTDSGAVLTRSQWIIYIPFWFIAALGVATLIALRVRQKKHFRQSPAKLSK